MSLFEYYAMGIPLFFPGKKLLIEFHLKYNLLCERTWNCIYHHKEAKSLLPRHAESTSVIETYDPNDDVHVEALEAWLQFADFYTWPHIVLFDSLEHLVELLKTTDLKEVFAGMAEFSKQRQSDILHRWETILDTIRAQRQQRKEHEGLPPPKDVNEALHRAYGVKQTEGCFGYVRE